MAQSYDLLVIGAGPGGLAASQHAAQHGARVAIAESNAVGGTCVNRGCVPKKLIVYAADFALDEKLAVEYGWSPCQRDFAWSDFLAATYRHIDKIHQSYRQNFTEKGIDLLPGRATFLDEHTVMVGDRQVSADNIIIAVGGKPFVPDIPGKEYGMTSRDMFQLPEIPRRLFVVGGGYIGIEFASMMNAFGCEVTLVESNEAILRRFDRHVSSAVQDGLAARGVRFILPATAQSIEKRSSGELAVRVTGETEATVAADGVLIATGRVPNTEGLGLEKVGVELEKKGAIAVDEYSRTSSPHIYAVGDCTNRLPLTPIAKAEAVSVVQTLFGSEPKAMDYRYVPSAVFSRPEGASVGLNETQARAEYGDRLRCHVNRFSPLSYALGESNAARQSLIKVLEDSQNNRILGAHMVGDHAADIIQNLGVAVRLGMSKQDLDLSLGIHPTSGEEFLTLD